MGNNALARNLGFSHRRNKDFQAVAPSPFKDEASQAEKIEITPGKKRKVAEVERIDDGQVKDANFRREALPPDYRETEGKLRRDNLADVELECSQISKFVFVSGMKVAANYDLLVELGIKRIINCAPIVARNYHEHTGSFKYLTVNMVDGRMEDVSWFVCEVIHFIKEGAQLGEKILIHCEKGVSRSCSMAIAHRMWQRTEMWKVAFDYVKTQRKICSPNTAFTCNLIELTDLFSGGASGLSLIFRCAYHAAYDIDSAVLKLCRNNQSRRILVPSTSLLYPNGVFVIRAVRVVGSNKAHELFVWRGKSAPTAAVDHAVRLARFMIDVLSQATEVKIVQQGEESPEFLSYIVDDGPFVEKPDDQVANYRDYYGVCRPTLAEIEEANSYLNIAAGVMAASDNDTVSMSQCSSHSRLSGMRPNAPMEESGNSSKGRNSPPPARGSVYNQAGVDGSNGFGQVITRSRVGDNLTIAGTISRTNSFNSLDSDGQSALTRGERMTRIHNIIDSATGSVMSRQTSTTRAEDFGGTSSTATLALTSAELQSDFHLKIPLSKRGRENDSVDSEKSKDESPILFNHSGFSSGKRPSNESTSSQNTADLMNGDQHLHDSNSSSNHSSASQSPRHSESNMVFTLAPPSSSAPAISNQRFVPMIGLFPVAEVSGSNTATNTSRPSSSERRLPRSSSRFGPVDGSTSQTQLQLSLPDSGRPSSAAHTARASSSDTPMSGPGRLHIPPVGIQALEPAQCSDSARRGNTASSCNTQRSAELTLGSSRNNSSSRPRLDLAYSSGNNNGHTNDTEFTPPRPMNNVSSSSRLALGLSLPTSSVLGVAARDEAINSLSRNPSTSTEPRTNIVSSSQPDDSSCRGGSTAKKTLTKPTLFQVKLCGDFDPNVSTTGSAGEWVAMGVYDDEDLNEAEVFLLLCPERIHYVWVGSEHPLSDCFPPDIDDEKVRTIVAQRVKVGEAIAFNVNWSTEAFRLQRSGEESEDFWDAFNDGF